MVIMRGDRVKIHYKGFTEDEIIFDNTYEHGKPLTLRVGDGVFLEKFEETIIGMEVGEKRKVYLHPEDAYGAFDDSLVQTIHKEELPIEKELIEGDFFIFQLPNGEEIPAKILEINDQEILVDMNHPLAGIPLIYEIEIIEIIKLDVKSEF